MDNVQVVDLLDHVMLRPSMYFKEPHLDRFECFICGYTCGCPMNERIKWRNFNDWVIRKHFKRDHSSLGCCGVVAINGKFGWKKRGLKELVRLWNKYKCETTSK